MNRIFFRIRYFIVLPIIGITITMALTFAGAMAKTIQLFNPLLTGGWRNDLAIVNLLEVIDVYLIGIVQLIVVLGLFELFIGEIEAPEWLQARSLNDLKKSIVDVLVVFVSIKGIERLVSEKDPMDALVYSGAVALTIISLTLFRLAPTPIATKYTEKTKAE